jgi:hypothetical protein
MAPVSTVAGFTCTRNLEGRPMVGVDIRDGSARGLVDKRGAITHSH